MAHYWELQSYWDQYLSAGVAGAVVVVAVFAAAVAVVVSVAPIVHDPSKHSTIKMQMLYMYYSLLS